MEELGLLNDESFARDYARELFSRKKFGSRRVRMELSLNGIDSALIDELLAEYADEEAETKMCSPCFSGDTAAGKKMKKQAQSGSRPAAAGLFL